MTRYGSSYNPCPDGMGVTTALMEMFIYNSAISSSELKNITYLICQESSEKDIDLGLALGLGLGLGIPFAAFLACMCYCMMFRDCMESSRRTARIRQTIENVGKPLNKVEKSANIFEPTGLVEINDILVPERHHHFTMDVLDTNLKRDIDGLSNEQLVHLLRFAASKYNIRKYIVDLLNTRDYGMQIV